MNQPRQVRYGDLDAYLIDPAGEEAAGPAAPASARSGLVILCHGYGAPGSDMVGIVAEWLHLLGEAAAGMRFLCPIAPHSLADLGLPTGRAWWPLNMERLMQAVQANRFDELHDETPPGLEQASEMLAGFVTTAIGQWADDQNVSPDEVRLAVGGFSQGAMLTMDTTLRGAIPQPALLMQFSGTVVCQPRWRQALGGLRRTHIYQSHGRVDPILPFSSAERLAGLIAEAEIPAEFHAFDGPHTIDMESISATAVLIQRLLGADR